MGLVAHSRMCSRGTECPTSLSRSNGANPLAVRPEEYFGIDFLRHEPREPTNSGHHDAYSGLALQLHILATSESMDHHDSEIMDDGRIDRGDA
jgi:hypothetical protein